MTKKRIDILIFEKGLTRSRRVAQDLIESGNISVSGKNILKSSEMVDENAEIQIKEMPRYVSRAGYKLEHAISYFKINLKDKVALDIGSSTGGFTDYLLQNNISKVYAVDVGSEQFDNVLKANSKIVLLENTDIRKLNVLPEKVDLVVIDVSFISLKLILPYAMKFRKDNADIVALLKPQFEVGRENLGKGGIVKNENARLLAIENVSKFAKDIGLDVLGQTISPIQGQDGNIEYFLHLK